MFRFGLFWVMGGSILMMAGLFPTPSSENFPGFLKPSSYAPAEISVTVQPALMAELRSFVQELPKIGQASEDEQAAPAARPSTATPQLALPSMDDVPESLFGPVEFVRDTNERLAVVASIVNFDLDKDILDATAMARLDDMVTWLSVNPSADIGIFGHTDLVGTEVYNDQLGQSRADRVAAYLLEAGIPEKRISVIMSYGEKSPMIMTEGISRDNRRVHVEASQSL